MGDVPNPYLFEFWQISSISIEEQLLMYDIPFTDNVLAENIFDYKTYDINEEFIKLDFSNENNENSNNNNNNEEEELYCPNSRIKDQRKIDVDELLSSIVSIPKVKTIQTKKDVKKQRSATSPEFKTDKYGFVVEEANESNQEVKSPTKTRKSTRDRGLSVARKKNHKNEEKWRNINKNWDIYLGEKRKKLKKLLRRGVPDSIRAELWKGLMDVNSIKKEKETIFQDLLKEECVEDFERVILKDLSRTLPHHIMFKEGGSGKKALHDILKAYSLYNPSVGYCQGMGFLVGMFLIYMPPEDAFFMLVQVIDKLQLSGIFAEGLKGVKEHLYIHSQLCKSQFPRLSSHLEETVKVHGCMPVDNPWDVSKLYATQWFFNIFIHVLPFEFILRIWDIILYEGFCFAHQVALAILKVAQKDLLKLNFDTLLLFLKDIDSYLKENITADQFINICSEFKISTKVTKLSKTYYTTYEDVPM